MAPPAQVRSGRWRLLRFIPLIAVGSLVAYFQLKPDPAFASVGMVPSAGAKFLDSHDFFSNALAFGALGVVTHLAFALRAESFWRAAGRAAILGVVVALLEFVQRFLPTRSCDWGDVLAGWIGLGCGSLPWLSAARKGTGHER